MTALSIEDSPDADRFVVNLMRTGGKDVSVRSVEIATGDVRNRYSFKGGRNLDVVFSGELSKHINDAISRLRDGERLLSIPDFMYSAPGLVLSGLRLLVSAGEDGTEAIMVRFKYYVGSIKQIFQFESSMEVPTSTVRERIAVDVLRDIVTPIFDLLQMSQTTSRALLSEHSRAVSSRLDKLDAEMEELKFYSGLLQRYVAGCQHDAAIGLTPSVPPKSVPELQLTNTNELI